MTKNYLAINQEFYNERLEKNGSGSLKNLWTREISQQRRFKAFADILELDGKVVLDVGCGYADFYIWMKENGIKPKKYIGVDLMGEHIKTAKERLPDESCSFFTGDFLDIDLEEFQIDVSVLSGALNLEIENWMGVAKSIFDKMWNISNEGMAFNLQSEHGLKGEYREKVLSNRNISPSFWCEYAHQKTCCYSINHNYMHYDYTVALWKKTAGWQEIEG